MQSFAAHVRAVTPRVIARPSASRGAWPRLALWLVLPLLCSCVLSPMGVGNPPYRDSSRLPRCREPLSHFTDFKLLPTIALDAIKQDTDKLRAVTELDTKLANRLAPQLDRWQTDKRSITPRRELVIAPLVGRMRIVGSTNRVFSGAYAGDSFIDVDVDLRDSGKNISLCVAQISFAASGTKGTLTVGSSDSELLDIAVEKALRFLRANYDVD